MAKLSEKQREEIKELYKSGKGLSEIARMFNCDHSTIFYWVNTVMNAKKIEDRRQRARKTKGYFKKPKVYAKRNSTYPNYRYNVKTLTGKSNSMYADYLAKELARQKKLKILRDTNGQVHEF